MRFRALTIAAVSGWWPVVPVATGLAQSSVRQPDNLAIPRGIRRTPVGTLGHVEVIGRGPVPLVLIPGAPFTWEAWRGFAQRNAERYTMYAVTLPGYGGTAVPALSPADSVERRTWSTGVVSALQQLTESRKLDRPVIVANHLMAAYYAVRLASVMQCRVGGIVAIASDPISGDALQFATPRDMADRLKGLRERWIPFFQTVDSATWFRGAYKPNALSHDSVRAAGLARLQHTTPLYTQIRYYLEYLSDDTSAQLATLRVPMLSLVPTFNAAILPDAVRERLVARWGSVAVAEDSVTYSAFWARRFNVSVPGLEMRVMPTKAAVVMDDEPAFVDGAVADFVAKRRGCL